MTVREKPVGSQEPLLIVALWGTSEPLGSATFGPLLRLRSKAVPPGSSRHRQPVYFSRPPEGSVDVRSARGL